MTAAAVCSGLQPVDPTLLSHGERIELLEALAAEQAGRDALRARTLAAIETADHCDKHWDREEVAAVLGLSPEATRSQMVDAARLVESLPRTLGLLAEGTISWRHVRSLVEATLPFRHDPDTTTRVEDHALTRLLDGRARTVAQFRAAVARAVATCDPRRFAEKHAEAVEARQVTFRPNVVDGTTDLHATGLPADEAAQLRDALDTAARAARLLPDGTRDPRSADQRRADALLDLARAATRPASADARPGPAVTVTVSASTLLGLDDLPALLDGHGPIPAGMARAIADNPHGLWRRILTDPAGNPIEVSRLYRPPAAIARYIQARDRSCRFPGCRRRAVTCHLDHIQPYDSGGPTAVWNLHALCARHHRLKHEAAGWAVRRLEDGTTRWTTPIGRVVDVPPDPYDDTPNEWLPPDDPDLDDVAPVGGYFPDEPPLPPWEEPADLDEREQQAA